HKSTGGILHSIPVPVGLVGNAPHRLTSNTVASPLSRHRNLLRFTARLPRWRRQHGDPLRHALKEPPRQIALRQEQPVLVYFIKRPPLFTSRCWARAQARRYAVASISIRAPRGNA